MTEKLLFWKKYTEAIGFDPSDSKERKKAEDCLSKSYEMLKFEIDNYWKRSSYIWSIQAASFVIFGLMVKNGTNSSLIDISFTAGFGMMTSLAGWIIARGSKFWQDNWVSHVDMLECSLNLRLTQVVFRRDEHRFSVTRANESMLIFIFLGWLIVLTFTSFPFFAEIARKCDTEVILYVIYFSFIILAAALIKSTRITLSGRCFSGGSGDWTKFRSRSATSIIWRDPPNP